MLQQRNREKFLEPNVSKGEGWGSGSQIPGEKSE